MRLLWKSLFFQKRDGKPFKGNLKNIYSSVLNYSKLGSCQNQISNLFFSYCLVSKSNHPFLVLKGVNEVSFLILKRISGNSEEDQYFILSNCSLVIELQFGDIDY
jgi:hypothetical protein